MRRSWSLLVVALLTGCFSVHEPLASEPARQDTADEPPPPPARDPAPEAEEGENENDEGVVIYDPNCDRVGDAMHGFLGKYCVHCHGDASSDAYLSWITDVRALVAMGQVIPDDPDNSPLYQMIAAGTMPPASSPQPYEDDKSLVRRWIQCGAPQSEGCYASQFTGIDDRLEEMLDDIRSVSSPEARNDLRYLELSPIANAGASEERLERYRATLHELLGEAVREVGAKRLTFRVQLGAAGFTPESWQALVADYPYDVRYDPDAELFPYDEETAAEVRSETGSDIPAVQADWFIARMAAAGAVAPLSVELVQRYERDLHPAVVASVLGIPLADLQYAMALVAQPEPAIVASLRDANAYVPRATFEAAFDELVAAIQLGAPAPQGD